MSYAELDRASVIERVIEGDARVSVGKLLANSGRSRSRAALAEDEGPTGSAPLLSNCCQTLVRATAG